MDEKNVILINTIKVDKYVESFFKTFSAHGYTREAAKRVEKAMFEYYNNYLSKNQVKNFKLENFHLCLVDYNDGKIFDEYYPQNSMPKAVSEAETEPVPGLDPDSLLALERSRVNIDFIFPQI
jgi:hypothetical protein